MLLGCFFIASRQKPSFVTENENSETLLSSLLAKDTVGAGTLRCDMLIITPVAHPSQTLPSHYRLPLNTSPPVTVTYLLKVYVNSCVAFDVIRLSMMRLWVIQ